MCVSAGVCECVSTYACVSISMCVCKCEDVGGEYRGVGCICV